MNAAVQGFLVTLAFAVWPTVMSWLPSLDLPMAGTFDLIGSVLYLIAFGFVWLSVGCLIEEMGE
ncbi:MAG: hypothetical protein AAF449_12490 [Myxococcota bacterium]